MRNRQCSAGGECTGERVGKTGESDSFMWGVGPMCWWRREVLALSAKPGAKPVQQRLGTKQCLFRSCRCCRCCRGARLRAYGRTPGTPPACEYGEHKARARVCCEGLWRGWQPGSGRRRGKMASSLAACSGGMAAAGGKRAGPQRRQRRLAHPELGGGSGGVQRRRGHSFIGHGVDSSRAKVLSMRSAAVPSGRMAAACVPMALATSRTEPATSRAEPAAPCTELATRAAPPTMEAAPTSSSAPQRHRPTSSRIWD